MLDDTPEPMAAASTPAPLISPRRHQIYHRGRRIWPLRHWICTAQHRLVAIVCAVPDTAKGPTAIRNGPLSTGSTRSAREALRGQAATPPPSRAPPGPSSRASWRRSCAARTRTGSRTPSRSASASRVPLDTTHGDEMEVDGELPPTRRIRTVGGGRGGVKWESWFK